MTSNSQTDPHLDLSPELPVLAFRDSGQRLKALLFNHSTHTIGVRSGGKRSPSFYGLAAQELEAEFVASRSKRIRRTRARH